MIADTTFRQYAIEHGLDVSYNFQSLYYSARATRIAYYDFVWAVEEIAL